MTDRKEVNKGNSYIMVVATLSFLAVLVSAILVAVALCYRLRAYDLNSRDNFYYLEQAMDEIYAGIGTDAMKHLTNAYEETIEVLVYFDTETKAYVTMQNTQANELLKNYFVSLLHNEVSAADGKYNNSNVMTTLESFVSNLYDEDNNKEGVQISYGGNVTKDENGIVIRDLVLRREAEYSTVNAIKDKSRMARAETFVQSISTDIVVSKPEFEVNFNTIGADLNTLYKYSMIADMGVEVNGSSTAVNISGNVYAASDFYNKDYNTKGTVTVTNAEGKTETIERKPLHNYSANRLKECNGVNEKSMYSGFYIDGGSVIVAAETMIVPGTLAVMNGGTLSLSGLEQSIVSSTDLWADNITLGGYSLKASTEGEALRGASASMRAKAYISDDLELNAAGSEFLLNGQYFGYSYGSTDNRTFVEDAVKTAQNRTFVSAVPDTIKIKSQLQEKDGKIIGSQAHYNSSAVIVNGADSVLDLSKTSALYVAGQSYIELSKQTTTTKKEVSSDETTGDTETVETYTYGYTAPTDKDGKQISAVDADGNPTADYTGNTAVEDNYSTDSKQQTKTAIQDYRTGEAISIKSNQLAYIPNWSIKEKDGQMYVQIPVALQNQDMFKNIWDNLNMVPVVKTVISGKNYYYFDFSEASTKSGIDAMTINNFIAEYSKLVNTMNVDANGKSTGVSLGATLGLTDIGDYAYFKVGSVRLNGDMSGSEENDTEYTAFTNSAISIKEPALSVNEESRVTIKAKSSNMKALLAAAENINAAVNEKSGNSVSASSPEGGVDTTNLVNETDSVKQVNIATGISTKLQSQYIEMKWLLTNASHDAKSVEEAHDMKESELTPINHYFNFNLLDGVASKDKQFKTPSNANVWLNGDDEKLEIKSTNSAVKGVIISKGDVVFDKSITEFQGLIVTGGKVIIDHSMSLNANEEIVKTVLRECDESQAKGKGDNDNREIVVNLFKQYVSFFQEDTENTDIEVASTKSIAAVQFEDILSFNNWKKNVD